MTDLRSPPQGFVAITTGERGYLVRTEPTAAVMCRAITLFTNDMVLTQQESQRCEKRSC